MLSFHVIYYDQYIIMNLTVSVDHDFLFQVMLLVMVG